MEQISFDLKASTDINTILKNLYLLTGMTATIYNSKKYWVSSYPLHNCNFCKELRVNAEYHARCRANDAEAFELCTKKREIIVYRCYMGLYEIMVPLFDQDGICGYIVLGQALDNSEDAKERYCDGLCQARPDISEESAMKEISKSYAVSKEKLEAIVQATQVYADYISEKNILSQEMNNLANLVSVYIREHFTEKITNAELCYIFLCDRKRLTREFKEAHGMSIIDYTNNLRLRKARQMLKANPDLSISYVSSSAGFSYQGYFCTLFQKKYGMSPTDMQKKYKKEQEEAWKGE